MYTLNYTFNRFHFAKYSNFEIDTLLTIINDQMENIVTLLLKATISTYAIQ